MGLGFCKFHKSEDIKDNVFEFDDKLEIVECPICHRQIEAVKAKEEYDKVISNLLFKARSYIFAASKYDKAYRTYAKVIDIQESNPNAHAGRILSLFMMSTLRYPRFDDCQYMLNLTYNLLASRKSSHYTLATLFDVLNEKLSLYLKTVKKKLMYRIYFHDRDCVELYLTRVLEGKNMRMLMAKYIASIAEKHQEENYFREVETKINSAIKDDDITLSSFHLTTNGFSYKPIFDKKGEMIVIDDGIKQHTNLSTYRPYSLDIKDKKKIYIRDRIFTSFSLQYNLFFFFLFISLPALFGTIFLFKSLLDSHLKNMYFILSMSLYIFSIAFAFFGYFIAKKIRNRLRRG